MVDFIHSDQWSNLRVKYQALGKRLVMTNGCFDLLHRGHVQYLNQAHNLGDKLLVALNSDDSVRHLKGKNRPLQDQESRAEILLNLRSVDYVTIFDDVIASRVIREIHPSIYVKGGDYNLETMNKEERAILEQLGIKIFFIPYLIGYSSTHLIKKIVDTYRFC